MKGTRDLMRKKLLFIRLMDDWAYQTQVRQEIETDKVRPEEQQLVLNHLMEAYMAKLANMLNFKPESIQYTLPWHRTFEVEINLDSQVVTTLS